MRVSPQSLLTAAAVLVVLTAGGAVHFARSAPVVGLRFEADPSGALRVSTGAVLRAVVGPEGRIPLDADLLREEPDQLGTWERYNDFMARHAAIAALMERGPVTVERADGGLEVLTPRQRELGDLPLMFWFQVAVGAAGFLLAAGVLAFRASDLAARNFAISGLGLLIFCHAAAVYSTREFVLGGPQFFALSMANQFGAMLFTAALAALLACYPRRLGNLWMLAYGIFAVGWGAYFLQWLPDMGWGYVFVLGLFGTTFLLAFVQWWRTRTQPAERAALRWFLLSVYLGTGLFAGVILIPVALGIDPPASQGLMFAVFLFMFAGIAMGITRYRLFDLDRWWFHAWSWFLGGVAVILFDFVLASMLRLSHSGAMAVALALSGWLYFPLRQLAWARWRRKAVNDRQERFGQWMRALFSPSREDSLRAQWLAVLRGEFAPLELMEVEGQDSRIQVSQDGLTLTVPSLRPGSVIVLRHPARGSRLFSREDLAAAEVLTGMARRALETQREREQVVLAERGRIMRDLHDDLGSKLLSLVYITSGGEGEPLARSAVRDMRDVLDALEAMPCTLSEALADWRSEAQGRADSLGFQLGWDAEGLPEQVMVSARQRTNISRVLREAITNALKHARAQHITVRVRFEAGGLALSVEDDGAAGSADPGSWRSGVGTRVSRQRAEDLGGSVRWERGERGCRVRLAVPLEVAAA
ncbi:ATP-binding protein [Myxococcaceae bacterium GXIMD 01537]